MNDELVDMHLRLPANLHAQLKTAARREDRPIAALIRRAVRAYLVDHPPDSHQHPPPPTAY